MYMSCMYVYVCKAASKRYFIPRASPMRENLNRCEKTVRTYGQPNDSTAILGINLPFSRMIFARGTRLGNVSRCRRIINNIRAARDDGVVPPTKSSMNVFV